MSTIQTSSGQARLTTLQGGFLTPRIERDKVVIIDTKGGKASVLKADLATSKGVIHVIDAVSMRG